MNKEKNLKYKEKKQATKPASVKSDNWTTQLFEEYLELFPYSF